MLIEQCRCWSRSKAVKDKCKKSNYWRFHSYVRDAHSVSIYLRYLFSFFFWGKNPRHETCTMEKSSFILSECKSTMRHSTQTHSAVNCRASSSMRMEETSWENYLKVIWCVRRVRVSNESVCVCVDGILFARLAASRKIVQCKQTECSTSVLHTEEHARHVSEFRFIAHWENFNGIFCRRQRWANVSVDFRWNNWFSIFQRFHVFLFDSLKV